MDKIIEFSTKTKEQKVNIDGIDFFITEMTGFEHEQYLEVMRNNMPDTAGGKLKSYIGANTSFLAHCMKDANRKPVSEDVLRGWSKTVLADLRKIAQKLNGQEDEEDDKAKNG